MADNDNDNVDDKDNNKGKDNGRMNLMSAL